jgi:Flp pilus assembly protein TadG
MRARRRENGQSMVELALILPFLLLLLVATVEAGFALRDYLMVQSANREGARLAVRTPPGEKYLDHFRDEEIGDVFSRIRTAAVEGGLRDNDVSITLTHIYIDTDGTPTYAQYFDPPTFNRTRLTDLAGQADDNATKTASINATRESATYGALENAVIIVEVFYRHEAVWSLEDFLGVGLGPFGGDWTMYSRSTMRMVGTGRGD